MVSAEKCLQLKVRETGQREERGQIFSDAVSRISLDPGFIKVLSLKLYPFTRCLTVNRPRMAVLCHKGYSWILGGRDHTNNKVG